jgi:hypothetical protein
MRSFAGFVARPVYLRGGTIGRNFFVAEAGTRAIEIRVRNLPEDSIAAQYGWIVYGFDGRVLDYLMS